MLPLLLAAALPPVLSGPPFLGNGCQASHPLAAAAPDWRPRPRKLGELPPAVSLYAVLREVNGCPVMQVMNRITDPPGGMILKPAGSNGAATRTGLSR